MTETTRTTKDTAIMIKVSNLYPHPDNPRKDLGDLTELVESIKKNGIMQNLTVIPIGNERDPRGAGGRPETLHYTATSVF